MALPAKQRFDALREALTKTEFLGRLGQVLPKHLTAERMVRIALHATNRNPLLLQCTTESLMLSLLDASQLGLEPSSILGTAYLVPYRNRDTGEYQCQLIAGYQGLIELARRSGQILGVEARVVYVGDEFEYAYGTDSYIKHKPSMIGGYDIDEQGTPVGRPMLAVYAVAHMKDARPQFEIMGKADVDAIRRRSRAAERGPWVSDYSEMARKTVVRRLCKYLPKSPELAHALELEDRAEGWGDFIDIEAEPSDPVVKSPSGSERIKERLRKPRASEASVRHVDDDFAPRGPIESADSQGAASPEEDRATGSEDGKDRAFATAEEVEELRETARRFGVTDQLEAQLSQYPSGQVPRSVYKMLFTHESGLQ